VFGIRLDVNLLIVFILDTDKWVCCRCVAELETNVTGPAENVPLVVSTTSDSKVDGKHEYFIIGIIG